MVTNVIMFFIFLTIVSVLGFFLWQTLFLSHDKRGIDFLASGHVQQQTNSNASNERGTVALPASNPADEAIVYYTKWLAIFTLFLVLATIALFISGERNVDVARQSADAAKRAADATRDAVRLSEKALLNSQNAQRAAVALNRIVSDPVFEPPGSEKVVAWAFTFEWKNNGPTRARNFQTWVSLKRFVPDISDDFAFVPLHELNAGDLESSVTALEAGAITQLTGGYVPIGDLEAIRGGGSRLYIWGSSTYDDIFEGVTPKRTTKFCVRLEIVGDIHRPGVPFSYPRYKNSCNQSD